MGAVVVAVVVVVVLLSLFAVAVAHWGGSCSVLLVPEQQHLLSRCRIDSGKSRDWAGRFVSRRAFVVSLLR